MISVGGPFTRHFALCTVSRRMMIFVPIGAGEAAAIGFAARLF